VTADEIARQTTENFFKLFSKVPARGGRDSWSGFDIRHEPRRGIVRRMSNPKLHENALLASGPLILTFAREAAAMECEC